MTENAMDKNYKLWSMLRKPFCLTVSYQPHKCEWENFSLNQGGCTLCGKRHDCCKNKCFDTIQTSEGVVCAITGIVIKDQNLQLNDYDDNYVSYGNPNNCRRTYGDTIMANLEHEIKRHMYDIVLSERARELFYSLQNTSMSNKKRSKCGCDLTRSENTEWNEAIRIEVLSQACRHAVSLIALCRCKLNMKIKQNELRQLSVGLLYLTRTGIRLHDICLLPVVPNVDLALPNENQLFKNFNFKAKNITDVENKFKFHLRGLTRDELARVGFHESY